MIATLCWKEYREQRGIWLAIVILAVVCVFGLGALARGGVWQAHDDGNIRPILIGVLVSLVMGHGVVCGAQLLANEKETGTLAFLDTLAPQRTPVWKTKLAMGCLLTVTQAIILAAITMFFRLESWPALPTYVTLSLLGLMWGMAGGAMCPAVFPAILVGLVLMIGSLLLSLFFLFAPEFRTLAQLALAGLGGFVSWRHYCETDKRRRPLPVPEMPKVLKPRGRIAEWLHSMESLCWLSMRQGRWVILAGLALSLGTGFLVDMAFGVAWPIASLVVGLTCGLCVFAFEQPGEQERFLGAQRLPPGRVWLWKTVFWALAAGATIPALLLVAFVANTFGDSESMGVLSFFYIRHPLLFLALWIVHGFCMGQFFALLTRRIIVAVVFAAAASLLVLAMWLPAVLFGGVNGWQILAIPLLLLLAVRLSMWTWFSGTLFSRKHVCGLIGCGLLSVLWLAGSLWQRAVEVPDVDEPFDLAEFDKSLTQAAQRETGSLIRQGANELAEQMKKISARLGPPTKPIFPDPKGPNVQFGTRALEQLNYEVMAYDILEKGWPTEDAEIGRWFDELFAGPSTGPRGSSWADHIRKAATMPPGLLADPRTLRYSLYELPLSAMPELPRIRSLAWVFSVRALQLQARGDDDAALAHLETVLALSRQFRHDAIRSLFFVARVMEDEALTALDRWLEKPGRQPSQLRKAIQMIEHHESHLPDVLETFKAEYVWIRSQMDRDLSRIVLYQPPTSVENVVLDAVWQIPWERARQLRLLSAAFQGLMHKVKSPRAGLYRQSQHDSLSRTAFEYGLPLPTGPTTILSAHDWGELLSDSFLFAASSSMSRVSDGWVRGLANLRVHQLFVALALYEVEHKKPAAKLEDLVPGCLPAMPLDPLWNKPFSYRISAGEELAGPGGSFYSTSENRHKLLPGQGLLWMPKVEGSVLPSNLWYFPVPLLPKK